LKIIGAIYAERLVWPNDGNIRRALGAYSCVVIFVRDGLTARTMAITSITATTRAMNATMNGERLAPSRPAFGVVAMWATLR
jgi:hypothetical protein